jgi:hypothetical protein
MKSNVIKISRDQDNLNKILCEVKKTAVYADLNAKQTLRTQLIAEELVGLLKGLSTDFEGEFWVEQENASFCFSTQIFINEKIYFARNNIAGYATCFFCTGRQRRKIRRHHYRCRPKKTIDHHRRR